MCALRNKEILENKMRFGVTGLFYCFLLSTLNSNLQANGVLSTGNLNCTFAMPNPVSSTDCGPSGTNLALAMQLPQLSNGIAGVAYGLSGTLTDTSLGTSSPYNSVVTFSTSGVPSGTGVV